MTAGEDPGADPGAARAAARPRRGRAAAVPGSFYQPPAHLELPGDDGSPVVRFVGEDARSKTFRFADLPLPGLHLDFAQAFARRVGPGGGRRTQRGATQEWHTVARFARAMASLADPPQRLEDLRVRHLERYRLIRLETCKPEVAAKDIRELLTLFGALPDPGRLDAELAGYIGRRNFALGIQTPGPPGYSDRELGAIMAAARADVAAIRDRIAAGERLLAAYLKDRASLSDEQRDVGRRLARFALTGRVDIDYAGLPMAQWAAELKRAAGHLFLTPRTCRRCWCSRSG